MSCQKEFLGLASVSLIAVVLPLLGKSFQGCGTVFTCLCIIQTTSLLCSRACIRKKVDDDEGCSAILGAATEFFMDRVAPMFLNLYRALRHRASMLVTARESLRHGASMLLMAIMGRLVMACLGVHSWKEMFLGGIVCGVLSCCIAQAFQSASIVVATPTTDGVVADWCSREFWDEPGRGEKTECLLADLDNSADIGLAAVVPDVDRNLCTPEEMAFGIHSRFLEEEEEQWSFLQSIGDSD